jgi:oligopeptide/dipeptide ABC transporter ATP-binding protein
MALRCSRALAILLLLSVSAAAQSHDQRPALTVALNAQPANLDPAETPFAANFRVSYSIFDTLIRRDFLAEIRDPTKGLSLAPGLATQWRRLDERTLELRLREGVRFHSGAEMSAEDVAFSLSQERIFGEKAIALQAKPYIGDLEAVEAVDRYTVRIRAAKPDGILEYRLTQPQAGIIPKDAYANGSDAFKRRPVGTGPLRFVEWRDNDRLRFDAFDDYFAGRPPFRSITFRIVPEQAARIAGLVSSEFDIITQVTPDQIALLQRYPDIAVRSAGFQSTQEILFDVRHAPVANQEVRRALSLAIDRQLIALDVTVQAQILALLRDIQAALGMALIIVTHDLGVVAHVADDAAVMYAGRIVERASVRDLFEQPLHPYTQALLAALPYGIPAGQRLLPIPGSVPTLTSRPSGCAFRTRCARADAGCAAAKPALMPISATQSVACYKAGDEQVAA